MLPAKEIAKGRKILAQLGRRYSPLLAARLHSGRDGASRTSRAYHRPYVLTAKLNLRLKFANDGYHLLVFFSKRIKM